ncbi:MAG: hypothetical protein WAX07_08960 [Candidatus Altiarchaeia archaeon]
MVIAEQEDIKEEQPQEEDVDDKSIKFVSNKVMPLTKKIYPGQVDQTIEYIKVGALVNKRQMNFYIYRIEPMTNSLVYIIKSNSFNYRMRTKNFWWDETKGVCMGAWGAGKDDYGRHKFDEKEATKLADSTGFELSYSGEDKQYLLKINDKIEPLMVDNKQNDTIIRKLILGWSKCYM